MIYIIHKEDIIGSSWLNELPVRDFSDSDVDLSTKFHLLCRVEGIVVIDGDSTNIIQRLAFILTEYWKKQDTGIKNVVFSPFLMTRILELRDGSSEATIRSLNEKEFSWLTDTDRDVSFDSVDLPFGVDALFDLVLNGSNGSINKEGNLVTQNDKVDDILSEHIMDTMNELVENDDVNPDETK